LAGIGRAKLEALRGIDTHRVEKTAADELNTRDERLRCLDVALDQGDAVDRLFELRAAQVLGERRGRQKEAHAQSLAAAVVLQDQRKPEPRRGLRNIVATERRDRRRRLDIEGRERLVLR